MATLLFTCDIIEGTLSLASASAGTKAAGRRPTDGDLFLQIK